MVLGFVTDALLLNNRYEEGRRWAGQLMEVSPYPDASGLLRDVRIYNRAEAHVEIILEGLALAGLEDKEETP